MICSADQYYCSVFQTLQEFNIQPGWRLGPAGMPRVHNMRFHPATWTHKSCMHIARHRRSDVGVQGEIGGKADSAKSGPLWSCVWKLELLGGTAVQRDMFVQQQGFQVLLAKF